MKAARCWEHPRELTDPSPGPSRWDGGTVGQGSLVWMRRVLAISLFLLGACRSSGEPEVATEEVAQLEPTCLSEVVVSVAYPGASPSEVEAGVLLAIEEAVTRIASVKSVSSRANEGHGLVFVETDGASNDLLEQVEGAVDGITSFPAGAERPRVFAQTHRGSYLVVVDDAQVLASADEVFGVPLRTIEIEADESKLRALDLDLDTLKSALSQMSVGRGPRRIEELAEVVVHRTPDDQPIYLRDVATIEDTGAPLPRAYRGEEQVVLGSVIARRDGEAPNLPGQLEVFGPTGCSSDPPTWVSVSATLPPGAQPADLAEIGRRVAIEASRVESRAVVLVGETAVGDAVVGVREPAVGTRIETLAPAGDAPDAAAAHLAGVLRQVPSLALVEVLGAPSSVALDVVHDDHEARRLAVQALVEAVGSRGGVYVATPPGSGVPELSVKLNARGHALGLTSNDVSRQVRTRMQGLEVARLRIGQEHVPVHLRLSGSSPSIDDVFLRTPTGENVGLGDVAQIEASQGSGAIIRRDRRRVTPLVVFGPTAAPDIAELIEIGEAAAAGVSIRLRSARAKHG